MAAAPHPARPLRVLTWHVHGSYLWYLSHCGHELYLPVRPGRPAPWHGRGGSFEWPDTVVEVPADEVGALELDVVLTQSVGNWQADRHAVLRPAQLDLPRAHIEHDPPRASPFDERHPVDDPEALLVHVTHHNRLMWDAGPTPTTVIEHGVTVPDDLAYVGDRQRAVVVVNNLRRRGRRLGLDVFEEVRRQVPVDLLGMDAESLGGLGELAHHQLLAAEVRYRVLFNPIRHTSLGLAVCEAMMLGIPIVGLATTEMSSVIDRGVNGWVDSDVDRLVAVLRRLLADPDEARRLGEGARRTAQARFGIERFARDWHDTLVRLVDRGPEAAAQVPGAHLVGSTAST